MRTRFYLDGIEINPPNNYQELEIELNYDVDGNQQAVSINDWEFGVGDPGDQTDGMIMCRNQLTDQTGIGVVQGKPFIITLDDERTTTYKLFDGYVDLWKAKYSTGKITAPAVQTGKIDWLNDYANSFTFEYLYSIKFFDKSYFVPVPYVIVKKQDGFEIIMTLVTIFVIVDKIKEQITAIAQLAAGSANPMEMSTVARLILQIIYLIILFISLIPLIIRIISVLCPPIKFHNVMYVRDLFKIACNYMQLDFKSSILNAEPFNKLVILPEKYNVKQNIGIFDGVLGDFKNNNEKIGYFKGTFGDLILAMKTMFYAKVVIDSGTLYFEPWDFKLGNNGIVIPYTFENINDFTLNYDDFYSTMTVSFLTDLTDRHTIQEYKGTSVQITQTAKTALIQKMSLLRNVDEARIQFALAKRKTELTPIEKALTVFLKATQVVLAIFIFSINLAIIAINALIAVINKIIKALGTIGIVIKIKLDPIKKIQTPSVKSLISNRLNMLKIESDYVTTPKIFLIDRAKSAINTKISDNNSDVVNARYLFDNFHYFKSFVPINNKPLYQYKIRSSDNFPFSFADFEAIKNNNLIFTPDGLDGKIMSLKFNPVKQTAKCEYRIREQYLYNLKLDIYEPDGS